jgi:hypothetical protein
MRRGLITSILNNGGQQKGSFNNGYSMISENGGGLDQFKRKKMREMIFGVK